MNWPPLNKKCSVHQDMLLVDLCTFPKCPNRLLCWECRLYHPPGHYRSMIPIAQIIKTDINKYFLDGQNLAERINIVFDQSEQLILSQLKLARYDILKSLEEFTEKESTMSVKSDHQTLLNEFLQDKSFDGSEALLKFLQVHIKILDQHQKGKAFQKSVNNILDRIQNSCDRLKEDLEYSCKVISSVREPEIPIYMTVNNLVLEKTVSGEKCTYPHSLQYIPTFDLIVAGDDDGNLSIWDAWNLTHILTETIHETTVYNIKYDESRQHLISSFGDGAIKVFKLTDELIDTKKEVRSRGLKLIKTIHDREEAVKSILMIQQKGFFLASGREPDIHIYCLNDLSLKATINTKDKGQSGFQMEYIQNKNYVVVGFKEGVICFYDLNTRTEVLSVVTGCSEWFIDALRYVESEDAIIASISSTKIGMWKFRGRTELDERKTFDIPKGTESILIYEGEQSVLLGTKGSRIYSLNLKTGAIQESFKFDMNECAGLLYIHKHESLIVADWESKKISCVKYDPLLSYLSSLSQPQG